MGSEPGTRREKRIDAFRKACREHGIRMTPQRLEIFLAVIDADDHPSAEEVFRRVRPKMPTISLDTVYRTLSTFDREGLVTRVYSFGEKVRFDPNTSQHHHVVCTKCRRVRDFDWPEIDAMSPPREIHAWGRVDITQVHIQGLCCPCLLQGGDDHEAEVDVGDSQE